MSSFARMKSIAGGDQQNDTVAAATTIQVPDDSNLIALTGSATVTALVGSRSTRNRIVTFYQSDSGSTVLTNTDNATAESTMDLGGSDVTLGQTDVVQLLLRPDGTWLRVTAKADN